VSFWAFWDNWALFVRFIWSPCFSGKHWNTFWKDYYEIFIYCALKLVIIVTWGLFHKTFFSIIDRFVITAKFWAWIFHSESVRKKALMEQAPSQKLASNFLIFQKPTFLKWRKSFWCFLFFWLPPKPPKRVNFAGRSASGWANEGNSQ